MRQATVFLDEETNIWFMYYPNSDESWCGLKLAPAGAPDTTLPTAPDIVTTEPVSDTIDVTWSPDRDLTLALAAMIVVFSLVGYAWFLIGYPNPRKGNTIKAGYLLHIFPFLALLAGNFLERLGRRSNLLYIGGLTLLAMVTIHNLPAMVTHHAPVEKMASWMGVGL